MFKSSFIHMLATGILFFLLYGVCGYITGLRADVPSLYLNFEQGMPFIPSLIIPYMLCDLVFVYVFFLCTSKEELKLLTKRMVLFISISAGCFLLFPLQFAFSKPDIMSEPLLIKWCFNVLAANDTVYNQAPSLHICFAMMFWSVVAKHIKNGLMKCLWGVFIFSIAVSTLLVYQHHIIDLVLAALLMAIVFLGTTNKKTERNAYIGRVYQLASALMFCIWYVIAYFSEKGSELGLYLLPIFSWIGLCLYLVGNAYVNNKPSFIKVGSAFNYINDNNHNNHTTTKTTNYNNYKNSDDGFISNAWSFINQSIRYVVYAPYIVGSYLNWQIFRNKKVVKVGDCFIGSRLKKGDLQSFFKNQNGYVIDLTCELPESCGVKKSYKYVSMPMLDIASHKEDELRKIVETINNILVQKKTDEFVYIHCLLGKSRSGMIAIMAMTGELLNSQNLNKINSDLGMGFFVPDYLIE